MLNVRHGGVAAVQPFVNVTTCFVASHGVEPFGSLKIATEIVASLPRLMVLGKLKLGLMSIRCVHGNVVVGTPLTTVMVPPQSLPSPMPLPSTSFLKKKSASSSLVISELVPGVNGVSLRPPAKSMAAENR